MTRYLSAVVVALGFVSVGMCIECHQCTTLSSQRCVDPYNSTVESEFVGECEDGDTHCMKHKTVSLIADSGFILGHSSYAAAVTRTCAVAEEGSEGCSAFNIPGGYYIRCICSGKACNSVQKLTASALVIVCLVLLSVFFGV